MGMPMDSGGGKITLDQESFRALASGVRVDILKRLDARRETVTDLSNLLALSKPTLLEHLEKLQTAGLVKRIDEGRKWIYYELSDKGRKILHPERVAITLVAPDDSFSYRPLAVAEPFARGHVLRFPLDALKVDRFFVREVHTDPAAAGVARAVR